MIRPVTKQAARLLHEGSLAMAECEHNGVRIDVPYLDTQILKVGADIKGLEKSLRGDGVYAQWRRRFGEKANLGSKQQLATVIFDVMGHERRSHTAKKVRSEEETRERRESKWNEEAFSHVELPFLKDYFRCQKLIKLKGTYLDGIRREVVDGFLHPFFDLHKVVTYRSSSSMPNFHNIPIRNKEIGAIIRRCFIPRKGRHLVEMDYSGIEVRIACCYTKDPQLIKEFTGPGGDPHGDTAVELFRLPKEFVRQNKDWAKKTVRDWAKNRFVFPSFYGSVYFQCAPNLWQGVLSGLKMPCGTRTLQDHLRERGITELGDCSQDAKPVKGTFVHHVKQVEDSFWNDRFKVYTAWKKRRWEEYLRDGAFSMYSGFVCDGVFAKNDVLNYPIQGFAFHCLLKSVIEILKGFRLGRMKSLMIGQIHDCSLADVTAAELQDYLSMSYEATTVKVPSYWPEIIVPMDVEAEVVEVGATWHDKKVWTDKEGVWAIAS